jgi:CHAD domain-containing protein
MKTTKEERETWRLDNTSPVFEDICDDADEAERLEAENSKLKAWLEHHEKAEPEGWHKLREENTKLRQRIEAFEDCIKHLYEDATQ